MTALARFLRELPLALISPLLLALAWLSLIAADLASRLRRRTLEHDTLPSTAAASVVIPNWNGRDLLEKYIPSVVNAAAAVPGSEVIVVDNGSEDDSVAFLRERYPEVRVVAFDRNLGFGGGSNAGFRAAKHDIVVLLNSDMRVDAGFLGPLLQGFFDASVFAVSCQIFFSDPDKPREETGLTEGWWENGALRVGHRVDDAVTDLYPCFYGGGGSCAFDRRKFLELGGFDELLAPFYLEDTDIGYGAWKRGWKVLYQPRSHVWHEHRGTIGKRFDQAQIDAVLRKNFILFCWKNIHEWRRLNAHFFYSWAGAFVSLLLGESREASSFAGIGRAFLQLPAAVRSRMRARDLAKVSDREAFRCHLGGYFRDRFAAMPVEAARPHVLFVSPYPICPPVHGGGVFMHQTLYELVKHVDVHLIALLDSPDEVDAHGELAAKCASAEYLIRLEGRPKALGSIMPRAVNEFRNRNLAWLVHRQIYTRGIDVVQLEYTQLAQYAGDFQRIPCILFEHDVYFQSIARGLGSMQGLLRTVKARIEYLRAIRYELRMLPRLDRIQVCSRENLEYLAGYLPAIRKRLDDGLRAGIDTSRYEFHPNGREPDTILFLGNFRHVPNQDALDWFTRRAFPQVLAKRPQARLIVIGSDAPPRHSLPDLPNIEIPGFVDDVRDALSRFAVFVCPILSGSGVRVKLLEAFAAGIPVVSTRLGAEGLASADGEVCALADDPADFAEQVLRLLDDPDSSACMTLRARQEVEENWDMARITAKLAESYRKAIAEKRSAATSRP